MHMLDTHCDKSQELVRKGNCIPVVASFPSDLLTPVSAYLKLCLDEDYAFLLGVQHERHGVAAPVAMVTIARCLCAACWPQVCIEDAMVRMTSHDLGVFGMPTKLMMRGAESSTGGSKVGRYSFIGRSPGDVIVTTSSTEDPLVALEKRLGGIRYVPHGDLPYFTGGAVGCVGWVIDLFGVHVLAECAKIFVKRMY